jgi:hypothetical protein
LQRAVEERRKGAQKGQPGENLTKPPGPAGF